MMLWMSLAFAQECTPITQADVLAVPPPAVVVLGERHGTMPDLSRARNIVRRFADRGAVTVALEAVRADKQPILDRYAAGELAPRDLPDLLKWTEEWGFPWKPYEPLVTAAVYGAKVVGAGVKLGPKPDDVSVPLPPRYADQLRDAMSGHEIPMGEEGRFVQAMAWRDYAIAKASVEAWNGEGYLVIVTGRGHVEGGKGVAFQAGHLTDAPIHSFVLAWGQDPPCYAGDQVWRAGLFEAPPAERAAR